MRAVRPKRETREAVNRSPAAGRVLLAAVRRTGSQLSLRKRGPRGPSLSAFGTTDAQNRHARPQVPVGEQREDPSASQGLHDFRDAARRPPGQSAANTGPAAQICIGGSAAWTV